ncbi:MAG: co-chaperone GroES [Planctomycetota bacterium]
MANVVPLGDKILVKRLEAEEKTAGGILLPDSAKEKPREGKVVALGKGKVLDNGQRVGFQVEISDRILFTSYGGSEIKINGEEYLVLSEDDVLAVIKNS